MIQPILISHQNQVHDQAIDIVKRRQLKSRPKTTQNHVTFAHQITMRETMGLDDYTIEEIDNAWYSEEEMFRVSKECIATLEKVKKGQRSQRKSERYCIRGLEPHTPIGSILKNKSRHTSIQSVLDEQWKQLTERGGVDVESLCEVYHNTTASSQMWAQVIGSRDHHEAALYLDDVDTEYTVHTMEQQESNIRDSMALNEIAQLGKPKRNEVLPRAA